MQSISLLIKKIIYLYPTKMQTKHKIFISPLHEQNTNFLDNLHIINLSFIWVLPVRLLEFSISYKYVH